MLIFGDRIAAIAFMFWPLWLAFRFDNNLGTFFVLTVLAYMVFLVIALLFAGLVAIATYGSIAQ